MLLRMNVICLWLCYFGIALNSNSFAQSVVTSLATVSCKPGDSAKITLKGKNLKDTLRIQASHPAVVIKLEKIEPTQAIATLTLPNNMPLGPLGLWIATQDGPQATQVVMVDDLTTITESDSNHSRNTAQAIPTACCVAGKSDGAQSDYFQFSVSAGQRVAFEILTQQLRSSMDPLVRIFDANGRTLLLADDDTVGPECRTSFQFAQAGQYWIEIRDSRYAPGGTYHFRIGDFPILTHSSPLAIRRGETSSVSFAGPDGAAIASQQVDVPSDFPGKSIRLSAMLPGGNSSAWLTASVQDFDQVTERARSEQVQHNSEGIADSSVPLKLPIGIYGSLDRSKEKDRYEIQGIRGQLTRFSTLTRSLGSPTLLRMELFNAANAKVAETKVSESDEWSFDFTFPDDGSYTLEVSDLLTRGGESFGYWVGITPAGSFAIDFKATAGAKDSFAMEPGSGIGALDLAVHRFGYDGEIILSLLNEHAGIRLLNPLVPTKAKEAKIYFTTNQDWKPDSFSVDHIVAQAKDNPSLRCIASSTGLQRLLTPYIPFPNDWSDGSVLLTGVEPLEAYLELEPISPIQFARPIRENQVKLKLNRKQKDFKAGVTLLGNELPNGWKMTSTAEKDVYTVKLSDSSKNASEPDRFAIQAISEFKGRSRLDTLEVPVEWIDPFEIVVEPLGPVLEGGNVQMRAAIVRKGNDPQPISLTLPKLPTGLTLKSQSIQIAADQSQIEFELGVASEMKSTNDAAIQIQASSKFTGVDFDVSIVSKPLKFLASPIRLGVTPESIRLDEPRARQQLVVTGFDAQGAMRDWTREARISPMDPSIVEVREGVVFPKSNGATELTIEVGKVRRIVPVRVSHFESPRRIELESDVLVALSKQGCNSGACHGSPSGKGSFRLSLRGFDVKLDELTLIREDFGRRVNPLEPDQSLLLTKPMMMVAHGGGKQLRKSDEAFAILRNWIEEGAKQDPEGTARCVGLEVSPDQRRVLNRDSGGQQVAVTACFANGTKRDVTHLAAYESSNTSVATIDKKGRVAIHGRGEAAILIRFLEHIVSLPLMFVEDVPNFKWKAPTPNNYIDQLVNAKLQQLQYLPSDTCSDSEFLRRVYLDVIGILPTLNETTLFLADASESKRGKLIDELLERDEYAKFWSLKWGDLLKVTSKSVGPEGVYKYHRWVEESIRNNMPYDEFARQLLTASGSTLANPAANFFRTSTDMNECVETISQVFLGARLQCAKCHNHPFERWTQDNYYGLGTFFQRVERRKTQRPGEMFIWTASSGEVIQPRTGKAMSPWLPQMGEIEDSQPSDRREVFAAWLTEPTNPYFARIEANRIWSQFFARGIVDPIDDFRDSNPPSNEPLLAAISKDFVEHHFDRKHLIRAILNSRTYQAGFQTNEFNVEDTKYFSHQTPRFLVAEQLLDAINQVLGVKQNLGGLPSGTLATHLPAPDVVKMDFLKVFGQPERNTVCACERVEDSNLAMAIELFNGSVVHEKLRDPENRFRKALAAGKSIEEIVRELYLVSVCREPSPTELQASISHCQSRSNLSDGIEDVCWAILNTDEFLFQH